MNINFNSTRLIANLATPNSVASRRATDATESQSSPVDAQETLASRNANALHQALQQAKTNAPQTSSPQTVKDKAGMLRQRLELLRNMIASSTPAQAKALAKQLQDLAKQLGVLAAELKQSGGNGGNGGTATPNLAATDNPADSAASTAGSPADSSAQAAAEQAAAEASSDSPKAEESSANGEAEARDAQAAEQNTRANTTGNSGDSSDDSKSKHIDASGKQYGQSDAHTMLLDLRKMLKAAWQELKPRLERNDPDTVRAVEDQMRETDHQLAEISDSTYNIAGSLNIDSGNADSANSGTTISVTA